MVAQTKPKTTIQKIEEIIVEYADCRDDEDSYKVAVEIYDLVQLDFKADKEIADNMRDYWMHLNCGAER